MSAAVASKRRHLQLCRMSGSESDPWFVWEPTATTVPPLRVVAPKSPLQELPGFGLLLIVQLVPSQCSINCSPKSGLSGPVLDPTAQTSLLARAATAEKRESGGFTPPLDNVGVGTMLQLVPLKCSARVDSTTGAATTWSLKPTAHMSLAAIAAVATSAPEICGLGATWSPVVVAAEAAAT
jgi:hypothetical protein